MGGQILPDQTSPLLRSMMLDLEAFGGYAWFGPMELAYYGAQAVHALVVGCYFAAAAVFGRLGGGGSFPTWSGCTPVAYTMLFLALATSLLRAMTCQFSLLALLANLRYLRALAVKARMGVALVGSVDPAIDLSFMMQLGSYCGALILVGLTWDAVPVLGALLVACADFLCFRLRFTQGHAVFKDKWSRCPLIDTQRKVFVAETQPHHMFALSYRWAAENASGFAQENLDALLRVAGGANTPAGFVDKECKWPDGKMATLDVNRNMCVPPRAAEARPRRALFATPLNPNRRPPTYPPSQATPTPRATLFSQTERPFESFASACAGSFLFFRRCL
jgi:hypothetical protein